MNNKYTYKIVKTLTGSYFLELEEDGSGVNLIYRKYSVSGAHEFSIANLNDGMSYDLPDLYNKDTDELFQLSLVLNTYGFDLDLLAELQQKLMIYETETREGYIHL